MAEEIRSLKTFDSWLEGKTAHWARLLALRSALRVIPLLATARDVDRLYLVALRAALIAWIGSRAQSFDIQTQSIGRAAKSAYIAADREVDATVAYAISAVARAATTVRVAHRNSRATDGRVASVAAAAANLAAQAAGTIGTHPEIWREVDRDVAMLEKRSGTSILLVIDQPLWADGVPDAFQTRWEKLSRTILEGDPNGRVWVDWYRAQLDGGGVGFLRDSTADEAVLQQLAVQADAFWDREPHAVNAEIAIWIKELSSSEEIVDPEPQNPLAPIFTSGESGRIDVDAAAANAALQRDDEAIDRHAEARSAADRAIAACSGNAASATRDGVERYREALGSTIETLRPSILILRGELLRQELSSRDRGDPDSNLPPILETALLALRALISAHNLLVDLDPALARRDQALLGPDAIITQISRSLAAQGAQSVADAGIATVSARDVLQATIAQAPAVPDPTNRNSRQLTETFRNFGRKVVSTLWVFTKVGVAATAACYALGQWALANEAWLLQIFVGNETMLTVVGRLLELLKLLPLA